ncbi:MAG: peptidoglycan endopeptidase [Spirochaetaceae bacterium]|jgi:hypothetical protein|nr:peptidoglycan endopeptidase [Spirochaetaceae bacterium]
MKLVKLFLKKNIQKKSFTNAAQNQRRCNPALTLCFLCAIPFLTGAQGAFSGGGSAGPSYFDLGAQKTENLASFSAANRIWGGGIQSVIEEAYRDCFKTKIIAGRVMTIRTPFAENHERDSLVEEGWDFLDKGKGGPGSLWPAIERALASDDFEAYTKMLNDGREKVVIFDIPERKWSVSTDIFDIARIKAGSYHGLPHKPYVLSSGKGASQNDVYNYLYCISWTGMDCSAFVWHVLSYTAKAAGRNLEKELRKALGAPSGTKAAWYAGTAFYNSKSKEIIPVNDSIRSLRPADIILFRSKDGSMAHSAIIQSIDFNKGVIRYLQNTDEAPQESRGVHESYIYFKNTHPAARLTDPSLKWSQMRYSPFPGERESAFSDDGERYRAYGGGRVVRLRAFAQISSALNSQK